MSVENTEIEDSGEWIPALIHEDLESLRILLKIAAV